MVKWVNLKGDGNARTRYKKTLFQDLVSFRSAGRLQNPFLPQTRCAFGANKMISFFCGFLVFLFVAFCVIIVSALILDIVQISKEH
jgi:hypothetical protein